MKPQLCATCDGRDADGVACEHYTEGLLARIEELEEERNTAQEQAAEAERRLGYELERVAQYEGMMTRIEELEAALAAAIKWGSTEYVRAQTLWNRAVWRDNERPDQPMLDDFTIASVLCDEHNSQHWSHELALLMAADRVTAKAEEREGA